MGRLDFDDLLRLAAPRPTLVVSASGIAFGGSLPRWCDGRSPAHAEEESAAIARTWYRPLALATWAGIFGGFRHPVSSGRDPQMLSAAPDAGGRLTSLSSPVRMEVPCL